MIKHITGKFIAYHGFRGLFPTLSRGGECVRAPESPGPPPSVLQSSSHLFPSLREVPFERVLEVRVEVKVSVLV